MVVGHVISCVAPASQGIRIAVTFMRNHPLALNLIFEASFKQRLPPSTLIDCVRSTYSYFFLPTLHTQPARTLPHDTAAIATYSSSSDRSMAAPTDTVRLRGPRPCALESQLTSHLPPSLRRAQETPALNRPPLSAPSTWMTTMFTIRPS